jgi:hypothetical protein
VIDYGAEVAKLPPQQVTEINALIDAGKLAEAEAILAELERARTAFITVKLQGGGTVKINNTTGDILGTVNGARAHGGRTFPGLHEVLEQGPELLEQGGRTFLMSKGGGNVIPATNLMAGRAMAGSGAATVTNVQLVVNAGLGTNGPQVGRVLVDHLETFYRAGGQPPRSG